MQYITYKNFKGNTIIGEITIPQGNTCEVRGKGIYYKGRLICFLTSQNARDYFAYNEDGNGLTRGQYIEYIKTTFKYPYQAINTEGDNPDTEEQIAEKTIINNRWEKFLADEICLKYRDNSGDSWVWNNDFYTAPIEDLTHIKEILENN